MNEAVIGILAVLIGLVACLAGYVVFRFVLPILGFLVGLGLGAQLAATLFDQPYLGSPAVVDRGHRRRRGGGDHRLRLVVRLGGADDRRRSATRSAMAQRQGLGLGP